MSINEKLMTGRTEEKIEWTDEVLYTIYGNDDLEELPTSILIQLTRKRRRICPPSTLISNR